MRTNYFWDVSKIVGGGGGGLIMCIGVTSHEKLKMITDTEIPNDTAQFVLLIIE